MIIRHFSQSNVLCACRYLAMFAGRVGGRSQSTSSQASTAALGGPLRALLLATAMLVVGCTPSPKTEGSPPGSPSTDSLPDAYAGMKAVEFSPGDPYRTFGYAREMYTGFGPAAPIPPEFLACHHSPVDTLKFEVLFFELRGDSLRGLFQDSIEGNPETPIALMALKYDTTARVLTFDAPTAARTLLSYTLSLSCGSLSGVEIIRTAYHPQDGLSGVSGREVTLRRGGRR